MESSYYSVLSSSVEADKYDYYAKRKERGGSLTLDEIGSSSHNSPSGDDSTLTRSNIPAPPVLDQALISSSTALRAQYAERSIRNGSVFTASALQTARSPRELGTIGFKSITPDKDMADAAYRFSPHENLQNEQKRGQDQGHRKKSGNGRMREASVYIHRGRDDGGNKNDGNEKSGGSTKWNTSNNDSKDNINSNDNNNNNNNNNRNNNNGNGGKADSDTDSGSNDNRTVPLIPVIPVRVAPISYITNQGHDGNRSRGTSTNDDITNDNDSFIASGNIRTVEGNRNLPRRMTPKKRDSEYKI